MGMSVEELANALAMLSGATAQTQQQSQQAANAQQGTQANLAAAYQKEQEKAAKKQKKAGLFGSLGSTIGGILGSVVGGPFGAAIGSTLGGTAGASVAGADSGEALAGYGMNALGQFAPVGLDMLGDRLGRVGGLTPTTMDQVKNQQLEKMFPGENPMDNYGLRPVLAQLNPDKSVASYAYKPQQEQTLGNKFAHSLQTGGMINNMVSELAGQFAGYTPTVDSPEIPMGLNPALIADALDRTMRQKEMDLRADQIRQQMGIEKSRLGLDTRRLAEEQRMNTAQIEHIAHADAMNNMSDSDQLKQTQNFNATEADKARQAQKLLSDSDIQAANTRQEAQLKSAWDIARLNEEGANTRNAASIAAQKEVADLKGLKPQTWYRFDQNNNQVGGPMTVRYDELPAPGPGERWLGDNIAAALSNRKESTALSADGHLMRLNYLTGQYEDTGLFALNSDMVTRLMAGDGKSGQTAAGTDNPSGSSFIMGKDGTVRDGMQDPAVQKAKKPTPEVPANEVVQGLTQGPTPPKVVQPTTATNTVSLQGYNDPGLQDFIQRFNSGLLKPEEAAKLGPEYLATYKQILAQKGFVLAQ